MKRFLLIYLLVTVCLTGVSAQQARQYIRQGNRLYRSRSYDKAEVEYRKAVEADSRNPQALYNLGCALMQQQKDSAAIVQFESAAKAEPNKLRRSKSYHNIGVICQGHRMFSEAVEAYKESLRLNPNDDETRYNLALCQRQLRNQQQGGDNQNNQQQDQTENENKQNPQQNQSQQDRNQSQTEQNQANQQQEQMSRENAEQLLEAAMRDEKDVQERMQRQQIQPRNRRLQKNW